MFFFAPILATLTSVAVLISSTVVTNANLIPHESRQAPVFEGKVANCTAVGDAYTVYIPLVYNSDPTRCDDAFAALPNITNWQCIQATDGNTQLDFNSPVGGADLDNELAQGLQGIIGSFGCP